MAWTFLQLGLDLFLLMGLTVLWVRLRKPPQDDPRLSRGLQLLQSKITVLEDLSDRTDSQVKQLTLILDQKTRFIQDKIVQAEQQVLKVEQSMQKSLEVAEIFQDKIPHEEVLERKRTIEYVKAARMAHQGRSLDEIVERVDLPKEQVELIAKFNRDQLMFDEEALPAWAKTAGPEATESNRPTLGQMDFLGSLEPIKPDLTDLQSIGEKFKETVRQFDGPAAAAKPPMKFALAKSEVANSLSLSKELESSGTAKAILGAAHSITQSLASTAANLLTIQESPAPKSQQAVVRKVEFPRIQMPPK